MASSNRDGRSHAIDSRRYSARSSMSPRSSDEFGTGPRPRSPRLEHDHSAGHSSSRPRHESRRRKRNQHVSRSRSRSPSRQLSSRFEVQDPNVYRTRHRKEHNLGSDRSRNSHRRRRSRSVSEEKQLRKVPLPSQEAVFEKETAIIRKSPVPEKQEPNFKTTGRLAAESNTITSTAGQTIVLKYHEPPEARKSSPKDAWRIYVFRGSDLSEEIDLTQRSCWLFGRENAVADFVIEHPSCSKQHAVIQFRYLEKKNEYGDRHGKVKPYLLDLESANGTEINGERIPASRYFEMRNKDVIKFAQSSREYVVMLPS